VGVVGKENPELLGGGDKRTTNFWNEDFFSFQRLFRQAFIWDMKATEAK